MSTSEFDRPMDDWEADVASHSEAEATFHLPSDFSEDDISFARELETFFDLDKEEIPPYFVQTLLDAEDPRFQPVEAGFEYKTRARVFRRLHLKRRLFPERRPAIDVLLETIPRKPSLFSVAVAFLLIIMLSVGFSATSFAQGMEMLLQNSHTGILQVFNRPEPSKKTLQNASKSSHSTKDGDADFRNPGSASQNDFMNLPSLERRLSFPIYMPTALPDNYTLSDISFYPDFDQQWVDGPSIDLTYMYGNSRLTIHEFKPKADVQILQVVKDGSAQALNLDPEGDPQAIYIDGAWVRHNMKAIWVTGVRCELLYQYKGVIFWIAAQQKDGFDQDSLLSMANSLTAFNFSPAVRIEMANYPITIVKSLDSDDHNPFVNDIVAVYKDNTTYYTGLTDSSDSSTSNHIR